MPTPDGRAPRLLRVQGRSMEPGLSPGDLLLLVRLRSRLPPVGGLVVVRDPTEPARLLVKRVASHGRDTFSVSSDNPTEGRDSRQFGSLPRAAVVGRVILVWPTGARAPRRPR